MNSQQNLKNCGWKASVYLFASKLYLIVKKCSNRTGRNNFVVGKKYFSSWGDIVLQLRFSFFLQLLHEYTNDTFRR